MHLQGSRESLVSAAEKPASFGPGSPAWTIERYRRLGWTEAQILDNFPTLRAADLVNVWAYVDAHAEEIETAIRENGSLKDGDVLRERELSSPHGGGAADARPRRAHDAGSRECRPGDPRSRSPRLRHARRSHRAHPESARLHPPPQARHRPCGHRRVHRRHRPHGP